MAAAEAVSLTLEGYTDWRLPTIAELLSVVDYARIGADSVAPELFAWFETEAVEYPLWTSTDYAPDDSRQWLLDHRLADTRVRGDSEADAYFVALGDFKKLPENVPVGPVVPPNRIFTLGDFDLSGNRQVNDVVLILLMLFRNGAPSPVHVPPRVPLAIGQARFNADSPFVDMVEDTHTGLFWMREPLSYRDEFGDPNPEGHSRWREALARAEEHFVEDLFDWRLPNAFELATLTHYAATSTPAMGGAFTAFSNADCPDPVDAWTSGCGYPFWGSTTAGREDPEQWGAPDRAYQFYPNNALDLDPQYVAPGAVQEWLFGGAGVKVNSYGWTLPVRGPDAE